MNLCGIIFVAVYRSVFCDASFFVALFSKKDAEDKRALEFFKEIKAEKISISTSWFIISEAITVLLYKYGYTISFVDALSHVLITGVLKNIPAISFDEDFRSLGLTTIS